MLNKSLLGKYSPISDGHVSLRDRIQGLNIPTTITVDQTHHSSKGDVKKGSVTFTIALSAAETKTETNPETKPEVKPAIKAEAKETKGKTNKEIKELSKGPMQVTPPEKGLTESGMLLFPSP